MRYIIYILILSLCWRRSYIILFVCMINLIVVIQLIIQLKGYFQLNPILALSLAITLFSFMGIPPLIGFFAKQAVLSAALQGGFYFLTLVGILTSVISAVYYLGIVKSMFFEDSESKEIKLSSDKEGFNIQPPRYPSNSSKSENTAYLVLSSPLSFIVSVLTLIILLFIFYPQVWLSSANILAMILTSR